MLMFCNLDMKGSSNTVLIAASSWHFQVIYNKSLFVCVYLSVGLSGWFDRESAFLKTLFYLCWT